jgi:hypothetical protein
MNEPLPLVQICPLCFNFVLSIAGNAYMLAMFLGRQKMFLVM